MQKGFLYAQATTNDRVQVLPDGVTEEDLDPSIPVEERPTEWHLKYICALERHCKELLEDNQKMYQDNFELTKKCKEHYDKMQELLRYELKWTAGERVVKGTVSGTGEGFEINSTTGEMKRGL